MPAAAYAARQQNSVYNRLLRSATSRFKRFTSRNDSSKLQSRTTLNHHEPTVLQSTDRKYAQYFNLTDLSTSIPTGPVDSRA